MAQQDNAESTEQHESFTLVVARATDANAELMLMVERTAGTRRLDDEDLRVVVEAHLRVQRLLLVIEQQLTAGWFREDHYRALVSQS